MAGSSRAFPDRLAARLGYGVRCRDVPFRKGDFCAPYAGRHSSRWIGSSLRHRGIRGIDSCDMGRCAHYICLIFHRLHLLGSSRPGARCSYARQSCGETCAPLRQDRQATRPRFGKDGTKKFLCESRTYAGDRKDTECAHPSSCTGPLLRQGRSGQPAAAVRGSLPVWGSAFRFYLDFWHLRNYTPPPTNAEKVAVRSCVFNDTASFGNYVYRLEKRRSCLNFATDWHTPCVRHVAKGLGESQNRSFRLRNFPESRSLRSFRAMIPLRANSRTLPVYSSCFLCARLPHLARCVVITWDTIFWTPQPDKARIGATVVDGEAFFAAKFPYRVRPVGGCFLRRPRFFLLGRRRVAALCRIHTFWAGIRRHAHPGQLLSHAINRGNFNRILTTVSAEMEPPPIRAALAQAASGGEHLMG